MPSTSSYNMDHVVARDVTAGDVALRNDRCSDALLHYSAALDRLETRHASPSSTWVRILLGLSACRSIMGKHHEALSLCDRALAMVAELDHSSLDVIAQHRDVEIARGMLLTGFGRTTESVAAFQSAIDRAGAAGGRISFSDTYALSKACLHVAGEYIVTRQFEKATSALRRAEKLAAGLEGNGVKELLDIKANVNSSIMLSWGRLYSAAGRMGDALDVFRKMYADKVALHGYRSLEATYALIDVGEGQLSLDDYQGAVDTLTQAISAMSTRSTVGVAQDINHMAKALYFLGAAEAKCQRDGPALEHIQKAKELYLTQLPSDHPQLTNFYLEIAEISGRLGLDVLALVH